MRVITGFTLPTGSEQWTLGFYPGLLGRGKAAENKGLEMGYGTGAEP